LSATQIDKDNLASDESVGTFRWNNDIKLINTPQFDLGMRKILLSLKTGWKNYVEHRF
jgi:hypothetical protein